MKHLFPIVLLCLLAGCRWSNEGRSDIYSDAQAAEVIVLAEVVRENNRERFFAREVLKGNLGGAFRFRIGEEITPAYDGLLSSGSNAERIDGVLLFYKQQFGVLSHCGMWSVKKNQILALQGAEADIATFVARIKEKANKAPEPTPRPVTIRAKPRIAPGRVVAHL